MIASLVCWLTSDGPRLQDAVHRQEQRIYPPSIDLLGGQRAKVSLLVEVSQICREFSSTFRFVSRITLNKRLNVVSRSLPCIPPQRGSQPICDVVVSP